MSDVPAERPVFQGAWNSATVAEREAHNRAVRAWKQAQGIGVGQRTGAGAAKAQSRMGAGDAPHAAHAADLALLQTIADDQQALPSDRIRAIDQKQRILSRVAAEQLESEHGPLVALRATLDTLPPAERVGALLAVLRADPPQPSVA